MSKLWDLNIEIHKQRGSVNAAVLSLNQLNPNDPQQRLRYQHALEELDKLKLLIEEHQVLKEDGK